MRPFHKARPWFFQLNYLVVWVVLIGIQFLTGFGQKPLLMMVMISFALLMQIDSRRRAIGRKTPNELKFYTAWGVWALLTAYWFISIKSGLQLIKSERMLIRQIVFLWASYALFLRQMQHLYFYWLLITIALIQIVAASLGFHLDFSVGELGGAFVQDDLDYSTQQMQGLTGNANSMGFLMLYAVWSCIMLWREHVRSPLWRNLRCVVFLGLIGLFAYSLLQTASRKSLVNFGIYMVGWLMWMIPGKLSMKSVLVASVLGVGLLIVGFFFVGDLMEGTVAMNRFMELSNDGGGDVVKGFKEGNIRYVMYVDGLKYWLSHPIAGIGLGQFAAWHFKGAYSHSDYIEPLACTGLVGFILYHGFAFTVLMRLCRLLRRCLPDEIAYRVKGMILFMICSHYLIGFGSPHWMEADQCMIVVFIGTWAWRVKREFVDYQPLYAT